MTYIVEMGSRHVFCLVPFVHCFLSVETSRQFPLHREDAFLCVIAIGSRQMFPSIPDLTFCSPRCLFLFFCRQVPSARPVVETNVQARGGDRAHQLPRVLVGVHGLGPRADVHAAVRARHLLTYHNPTRGAWLRLNLDYLPLPDPPRNVLCAKR